MRVSHWLSKQSWSSTHPLCFHNGSVCHTQLNLVLSNLAVILLNYIKIVKYDYIFVIHNILDMKLA